MGLGMCTPPRRALSRVPIGSYNYFGYLSISFRIDIDRLKPSVYNDDIRNRDTTSGVW